MGAKLRKVTLSVLVAGLAVAVWAPSAEARRNVPTTTTTTEPSYVPPPQYGQNPHPELPEEPDPYAGDPTVLPTVVTVDLPAVADPGAGLAGDGTPLGPVSDDDKVLEQSGGRPATEPAAGGGFFPGILSRTGAETLPLARAGLAAVALGLGLVLLARRRRVGAASG